MNALIFFCRFFGGRSGVGGGRNITYETLLKFGIKLLSYSLARILVSAGCLSYIAQQRVSLSMNMLGIASVDYCLTVNN